MTKAEVDKELCLAWEECIQIAHEAFEMRDDVAEFVGNESIAVEELVAAAQACPTAAITVWDSKGQQVYP